MTVSEKRKNIFKVCVTALMAALVFAGNYIQIPLPFNARIHLGNAVCLLSGLLFGGVGGGLASGIGAGLYDLLDPRFITSAPYTFISKFAMGFAVGVLNRHGVKNNAARPYIAAAVGQLIYIVLYLGKNLVEQLLIGNAFKTAVTVMLTKAGSSLINGGIAVAVSVPLYLVLKKTLEHTAAAPFITQNKSEERSDK